MKLTLILLTLILTAVLAACGVAPGPALMPTVTPVISSSVPEAGGACSPVDLSTFPESAWLELLRPYVMGVACIQADWRQGTGFVVRNTDSGEGYLLTSAHMVGEDPARVSLQLDNEEYDAEVIKISVERDLAMVRICCGDFVVLKQNNRGPRFGEQVLALGFPDGEFTYSRGVLRTVFNDWFNTYLEHTADLQPGYSGGPLLAFSFEAVQRATEGGDWELREGESLGVLGVTVGKSPEYEHSTYAIDQAGVSSFVTSVWSSLGLEHKPLSAMSEW